MTPDSDELPYPESELVTDVNWSDTTRIEDSHGDNWPMA